MNRFLMCAAVLALSSALSAQVVPQHFEADCIPRTYPDYLVDIEHSDDLSKVYTRAVPIDPAEVWMLESADVYTAASGTPSPGQEFKLEIIVPLAQHDWDHSSAGTDAFIQDCCIRVAIATPPSTYGTPFVSLQHPVVMRPGERLAGRTTAKGYRFGVTARITRYPGVCLAALQWGR